MNKDTFLLKVAVGSICTLAAVSAFIIVTESVIYLLDNTDFGVGLLGCIGMAGAAYWLYKYCLYLERERGKKKRGGCINGLS